MGYYVKISKSSLTIAASTKPSIYKVWCDLNDLKYNAQKRGGSWSSGGQASWNYSWMDEDYPSSCQTMEEILDMLGFEFTVTEKGDIKDLKYENKTGQEQIFFKALAPYITRPALINWRGEDGARYSWIFGDGKFFECDPEQAQAKLKEFKIQKEKKKLEKLVSPVSSPMPEVHKL